MPPSRAKQQEIAYRREHVASLRLRRLTEREIVEELEKKGVKNLETGEPYDQATVHRDCAFLEKQWKVEAAEDIAKHKGEHLAELREVRKVAWSGEASKGGVPQLFYVLKSLEQEARVLRLEEQDIADRIAELAQTFLAGYNMVESLPVEDMSE